MRAHTRRVRAVLLAHVLEHQALCDQEMRSDESLVLFYF